MKSFILKNGTWQVENEQKVSKEVGELDKESLYASSYSSLKIAKLLSVINSAKDFNLLISYYRKHVKKNKFRSMESLLRSSEKLEANLYPQKWQEHDSRLYLKNNKNETLLICFTGIKWREEVSSLMAIPLIAFHSKYIKTNQKI